MFPRLTELSTNEETSTLLVMTVSVQLTDDMQSLTFQSAFQEKCLDFSLILLESLQPLPSWVPCDTKETRILNHFFTNEY